MEETNFDKREWIQTFKKYNREFNSEFISRFKPLILFKKDFTNFIDDSNREADKLNNKFITFKKNKVKELGQIKSKILLITLSPFIKTNLRVYLDMVLQAKKMKAKMYEDQSVIDKLQSSVTDINATLKDFKIKNKNEYGRLAQEEEMLSKELELLEDKFDAIIDNEKASDRSWYDRTSVSSKQTSMTGGSRRRPASVASSKKSYSTSQVSQLSRRPGIPLPPTAPSSDQMSQKMIELRLDIERIEDKIASNGGFHWGWPPSDHEDFLRVKTKHKHKTDTLSFLNEILGLIPDWTIEKIKDHIKIHKEYIELCKEKKECLKKYKQEKIVQRNTKLQTLDNPGIRPRTDENNSSLINRSYSSGRSTKVDREKQKAQIQEWKKKKEEATKLKKQEEESKRKQLQQRRKEKKQEELEWKAHKVKQYQLQKELKEEQKKEMERLEKIKRRQKYEQDQATRERIFKREEDLFRKRAELVITKKCIEEEKQMRLERTKFMNAEGKYDKVESRLNQVTKAAKGKNRDKFKAGVDDKKDAMTFGGQLVGPSMRAQPSWRKGL